MRVSIIFLVAAEFLVLSTLCRADETIQSQSMKLSYVIKDMATERDYLLLKAAESWNGKIVDTYEYVTDRADSHEITLNVAQEYNKKSISACYIQFAMAVIPFPDCKFTKIIATPHMFEISAVDEQSGIKINRVIQFWSTHEPKNAVEARLLEIKEVSRKSHDRWWGYNIGRRGPGREKVLSEIKVEANKTPITNDGSGQEVAK